MLSFEIINNNKNKRSFYKDFIDYIIFLLFKRNVIKKIIKIIVLYFNNISYMIINII